MQHMALNIDDTFAAVLDREAMEVLIYDRRYRGDDPRGSRRQDQRSVDGQFVTSILTGMLIQHGDNPWNMVGHIDHWSLHAGQVQLLRTWIRGVLRDGEFPTGDGTSFINNRWTYTGPAGYRVRKRDDGLYSVVSYTANRERVAGPFAASLGRDDAYALAATLANGR